MVPVLYVLGQPASTLPFASYFVIHIVAQSFHGEPITVVVPSLPVASVRVLICGTRRDHKPVPVASYFAITRSGSNDSLGSRPDPRSRTTAVVLPTTTIEPSV